MVSIRDEAEDFVAPVFVLVDHAGEIGGAAAGADDEQRAVVESFRSHVARDHAQHDFFQDEEQRRQRAEENKPCARELTQRHEIRDRREEKIADDDDTDRRHRFLRHRNRAMAVIAVIREEQRRPDDQNQRVDLQILLQRKESGRKTLRSRERKDDVADEERGEESGRRQCEVGEVNDPRDQSRFLLQHSEPASDIL